MTKSITQKSYQRAEERISMSGAFSNCFFHAYALHIMAHDLPFPDDLFSFQSIGGEKSPATLLQKQFSDRKAFDLFAQYASSQYTPAQIADPSFIVEKTLILGLLLREWFATQLYQNEEHKGHMLHQAGNGVLTAFMTYKNFREFVGKEDLCTGEQGMLYESNEDFLEYYSARTFGNEPSMAQKQRFEHYFTDANEDESAALSDYWYAEGYSLYCRHLARPNIMVAPNDVMPVIALLNQPILVCNLDEVVLYGHASTNTQLPDMKIMLNVLEGHYYLATTTQTSAILNTYALSLEKYVMARGLLLSHADRCGERAHQQPVSLLLVGAICREENLLEDPVHWLLEKIALMAETVAQQQLQQPEESPQQAIPEQSANRTLTMAIQLSGAMSALGFTIAAVALALGKPSAKEVSQIGLGVAAVSGLIGYGLYKYQASIRTENTENQRVTRSSLTV